MDPQPLDQESVQIRTADGCSDSTDERSHSASTRAATLYTAKNAGFLAQYFVIGLVYGGLPATLYGVLSVYLNTPGYVYDAAGAMATLPWSFKAFYGGTRQGKRSCGASEKPATDAEWPMLDWAAWVRIASP